MQSQVLFTVGYEGYDISSFIDHLKAFNITRLIDVREIPLSRKKGFSKSALRKRSEAESIEYVHIKSLGSPSRIRDQLKHDHDYVRFFSSYTKYLTNNFDSIMRANELVLAATSCLMCFEHSSEKCHRSIVAQIIKKHNGDRFRISDI
jgi:uncharacterized protein (DUF488 family)